MNIYDGVTSILVAAAGVCILIAAATSIFGEDNILQNNPLLSGFLLVIFLVFLVRQGNERRLRDEVARQEEFQSSPGLFRQ